MRWRASPLRLPWPLQRRLETTVLRLLRSGDAHDDDFTQPAGEPALIDADSVSWRVFKNPVVLFVGGVAAVVLELAEPRVRSGVWDHTSFRERPLDRLRRTGFATMMTVYGPRSRAEALIERVNRLHTQVRGRTPDGEPYAATDPELLVWVQATASFGFLQAYHAYVHALDRAEHDRFYAEGRAAAQRFGAADAPDSRAALEALFERMHDRLEASPIVLEFLDIVEHMAGLPPLMRSIQPLLVRAAVGIVPAPVRERLGLGPRWDLRRWQRSVVICTAAAADRLLLRDSPAVQACRRLGLPDDHLYVAPRSR